MKYLPFILMNLFRSKRRTFLTILSIGVSMFIFAALMSLPGAADRILSDSASSLRVFCHSNAGLTYSLPESYKQKLAIIPHVQGVVARSWFGGIYHDVSDQFPNLALDSAQMDQVFSDWGISREAADKFKLLRTACLVGPGTMARFHWRVGQQIVLRGTIYRFNLTLNIVGVTGGKAPPNFLIFRRDYLEEAAGRPGRVMDFVLAVDSSASIPGVIAAVDRQFANSSAPTRTESESDFISGFVDAYRGFFHFTELLGLIVVFTIVLVAANTAAMSIRERRNEIAVMRAIGFGSTTILILLVSESLLIGVLGGLLGCGLAFGVLKTVAAYNSTLGPIAMLRVENKVLIETLLISAMVGVLSAYVPARSAATRNIVETLRMVA